MLLLLTLLSRLAWAVDEQTELAPSTVKTPRDYASDLTGESAPDRTYAARALRGQVRRAVRRSRTGVEGSLFREEARAALVELEALVPGPCTAALADARTAGPCADALADLGVTSALPALREARAAATRRGLARRLDGAIQRLGGGSPADDGAP
jgi:hypothetical protein